MSDDQAEAEEDDVFLLCFAKYLFVCLFMYFGTGGFVSVSQVHVTF